MEFRPRALTNGIGSGDVRFIGGREGGNDDLRVENIVN